MEKITDVLKELEKVTYRELAVYFDLTAPEMLARLMVPVGVWFEWQSLAGFVDRPRYRCERLVAAGFMNSKVTNPGNPFHGTKFQKIREVIR
ncbi:hypothetical protein OXA72_24825 [Klebsiella pneumoniae]